MALYAIEELDDALDVTRAFLTPVDRAAWLKLAVVAVFVGGPAASFFPFGGGGEVEVSGDAVSGIDLDPQVWLLVLVGLAALLVVGLLFALVGSIMEFVFVESLRSEEVTIRRYWRRRWRQGVALFGFRLVLGLFVVAGVLLLAAPFALPFFGIAPVGAGLAVVAFLLFLPIFLVLALAAGLVHAFTTVFVVPVMILEETGVLAGWRRLWPTITAHWKQYLAYAVAGVLLSMAGGVAVGVTTAVGAVVLLVPFGLLFVLGGLSFAFVSELLGIVVLGVVGTVYALAVVAVAALAMVPVKTYLRYYALLVLGDVEPEFDLVPDQRAAVGSSSPE